MDSEYIKKLQEALKEHTQLKNDLEANKLMTLGIQQNTAITQKPLIDAIKGKENENNQTLSIESKPNESHTLLIKPLEKESLEESYNLIKTSETISPKGSSIKFPIWKIKTSSRSNVGKFVLFQDEQGVERVWQYTSPEDAPELTEGLSEILFNNAGDITKITDSDRDVYRSMIANSGLESSFTNKTTIYKKLFSDPQPQIEELTGDGLGGSKEVITIPENPDELREQLLLQLQAQSAGHRNTFDYANAIMKKLLGLKALKSKDYREILRIIYNI